MDVELTGKQNCIVKRKSNRKQSKKKNTLKK